MNENKDLLPDETNENTSPNASENQKGNVAFSDEEANNKEKVETAEENDEAKTTEASEKKEKKKKRLFLMIAIIVGLLVFAGLTFFQSKGKSLDTDKQSELVPPINFMQYVTGIEDGITVLKDAKDIDFMKNIAWDEAYINEVTCDTSKVDLSKVGAYELTYTIDVKDENEKDITKTIKVIVSEDKKAVEAAEKEAEAKQEEAKNNAASSNNTGSTSSNTGSSNNTGSNNTSGSSSNNNSSSNNSSSNKPTTPTHTHNWVAVTKTVHHDEQGHYENVCVEEAWDEPIYEWRTICNCGADITDNVIEHAKNHMDNGENSARKNVYTLMDIIHHDAVYEKQWVVDQAAYDETVTTGYKCSCGATK